MFVLILQNVHQPRHATTAPGTMSFRVISLRRHAAEVIARRDSRKHVPNERALRHPLDRYPHGVVPFAVSSGIPRQELIRKRGKRETIIGKRCGHLDEPETHLIDANRPRFYFISHYFICTYMCTIHTHYRYIQIFAIPVIRAR